MPRVSLGNPHPIFNGRPTSDPTAVTVVDIPDSKSLAHAVRDVTHRDGLWWAHSADSRPAWVECLSDLDLEAAIAGEFGCPAGRPAQ